MQSQTLCLTPIACLGMSGHFIERSSTCSASVGRCRSICLLPLSFPAVVFILHIGWVPWLGVWMSCSSHGIFLRADAFLPPFALIPQVLVRLWSFLGAVLTLIAPFLAAEGMFPGPSGASGRAPSSSSLTHDVPTVNCLLHGFRMSMYS